MVQFSLTNTPADIDGGAGPRVAEGRGHFLVTKVEEFPDYIKVVSEVIAHDDADSVGKLMYDRLSTSGKFAHRGPIFARACGVLSNDDIKKAQADKKVVAFEIEDLFSRTFCGDVVHRTTDRGTFANFGWRYLSPAEGAAEGYPVDKELV